MCGHVSQIESYGEGGGTVYIDVLIARAIKKVSSIIKYSRKTLDLFSSDKQQQNHNIANLKISESGRLSSIITYFEIHFLTQPLRSDTRVP